jgi:hypothetical protein
MVDVLDYIAQKGMDNKSNSNNNNNTKVFTYCGVGCNQGDLTMDVARTQQ